MMLNVVDRDGEQLLEDQTVGERDFHAPAFEGAREDVTQQAQPLDDVIGPDTLVADGRRRTARRASPPFVRSGSDTCERVPARR